MGSMHTKLNVPFVPMFTEQMDQTCSKKKFRKFGEIWGQEIWGQTLIIIIRLDNSKKTL